MIVRDPDFVPLAAATGPRTPAEAELAKKLFGAGGVPINPVTRIPTTPSTPSNPNFFGNESAPNGVFRPSSAPVNVSQSVDRTIQKKKPNRQSAPYHRRTLTSSILPLPKTQTWPA